MKQYVIFITLFLFLSVSSKAINLPEVFENTVNSETIKTIECYRSDSALSAPLLRLNTSEELIFSFDDLLNNPRDYYYTIYHCDRNWELSQISRYDYLDSYTEYPIEDYAFSVTTKVRYINYRIVLPNENIPLKLSGNYALVVYDYDNPEDPLIIWRFYVVDHKVSLKARIRRATHDPINGENQEVDFKIITNNFPIRNAFRDIKTVITQNNRSDNAITNLKPQYISTEELEYDYDEENVFSGMNEFRNFETRGIKHPGAGVEFISFQSEIYNATLTTHKIRTQHSYSFRNDLNGKFYITAYSVDEPNVEADYQLVHFTLPMNQPLMGGVYVFGQLSNWQCTEGNKMKWDFDCHQYELSLLLKQGYYNFVYAFKDPEDKVVNCGNLEGNHYETENNYQIYVYYGDITDEYDQLIGYGEFNSTNNYTY